MNGRDFECSLGVRLSERGSDLHSVIEKVSKKMSERVSERIFISILFYSRSQNSSQCECSIKIEMKIN